MGIPQGVKWWIPGLGLLVAATAITAGFGWTVGRATHRDAVDALANAGIQDVTVTNAYRDVTLAGPASAEASSLAVVGAEPLVLRVVYLAEGVPEPEPEPSPSPTSTAQPSPTPTAQPSPTSTAQPSPTPDLADSIAALESALSGQSRFGFAFESAELSAGGKVALDNLAEAMTAALAGNPGLRLAIAGHTDSVGPAAYNVTLSAARANAVRDYLVSRGVPITALSTAGYGESAPVATNATADGRAVNRRVDLTLEEG
jgi:OOP family OmpA-OmpF porin